jgi:hypothetical protein
MSNELESTPPGFFDLHTRILGLVLLLLGAVIGFVGFYFPLHDAMQGAEKVSYYPKTIFICVLLIIVGLAFIILGPIAARIFLRFDALTGWKKWLFLAMIALPPIACAEVVEYIFRQYLDGFGYKF